MVYAIELTRKQSRRILECVCSAQVIVQIQPKSWSKPAQARLVSGDNESLGLEADCTTEIDCPDLPNMYCQVDIELEQGQYFFDSYILSARQRDNIIRLSIAWPETILVRQRRRSGRKKIATSSKVQLSRQQDDQFWCFEGQLYNLSENGLAFRLPEADTRQVEIGQRWCACFEIPEQSHCYKFNGTVRRKVPSSSQGDIIVGIEFHRQDADEVELAKLREFLNACHDTETIIGELK